MPEIDIIHVARWTERDGELVGYEAYSPNGVLLHDTDPNFGLAEMASLGEERGVTRWSERSEGDGLDVGSEVVLVGWAEAPIAREDVDTHSEGYDHSTRLPAVNIKVYETDLPKGEAFKALVEEHELDSRLAALPLDELRTLIEQYVEKHEGVFYSVCSDNYDQAKDDAIENIFVGRNVKIHQEGRSGGYMVVGGLPDIEHWDAKLLTEWDVFQRSCKSLVESVPEAMVWSVLANNQDELAGRVVSVKLTFILCEEDLAELEAEDNIDPKGWDWHAALDFQRETEIRAE